jgi:acetyl-CoA C-acetyltransferase
MSTREIVISHPVRTPIGDAIINVKGGATGAVLATRLIHSMRRDGLRRGIVTLCIGGGQGIALALEAL